MPTRTYDAWNPTAASRAIIATANQIAASYQAQGYDLTLRQLYYQFVSRDLLPNTMRSYKNLGETINKARMAGLLDWSYIVDRTRNLRGTSHWDNPADVIESAAQGYRIDKWSAQATRVEVWVEKEALSGIVQRTADAHDVDWFACRGYVSQSEQWQAGQRFGRYLNGGQNVVILHLGDHDPSGIDMTRDIRERITRFIASDWYRLRQGAVHNFAGTSEPTFGHILDHITDTLGYGVPPFEVRRIALNMDQVEEYDPPPNPAKLTDSRGSKYVEEYGDDSWELDALDPAVLDQLITEHIEGIRDQDMWELQSAREDYERGTLRSIADRYEEVAEHFGNDEDE